ncbi:hypothetical protein ACVR0S_03520 [Streptococcus dentapri]|uniref:Phage protein n=1 Tax=Streptococcus dentapri TaxID=573564 RepID=A0ABV8D261_9STRE
MIDKKRQQFKRELLRLIYKEKRIQKFQLDQQLHQNYLLEGKKRLNALLRVMTDFSLAVLPEAKRRGDLDFAKELRHIWDKTKGTTDKLKQDEEKIIAFGCILEEDLAHVREEKKTLFEQSRLTDEEIQSVIKEIDDNINKGEKH